MSSSSMAASAVAYSKFGGSLSVPPAHGINLNNNLGRSKPFEASRIHYQFRLLPTKVAAKYCPKEVFLFQFLGMTLGGIFCVEYTNTPIGPYREVAFLSGLVGRRSGIGAWASHIVVDSEDAAVYGERFWGLPAEVLPIDLVEEEGRADGVAHVLLGEERVRISGWKTTSSSLEKGDPFASIFSWLDVSLPSFSGRLLRNDSSSTAALSPLLRYPLRIQSPGSISLVGNGPIRIEGTGRIQTELEELFSASLPLVSLQIDDVRLTAGVATVESD